MELEIIDVYSRADAIDDGVLVDVSHIETVFKHPVAITTALHVALSKGKGKDENTYAARLWDVTFMSTAATAKIDGPDSFFPVIVGRETLNLRANVEPGDNGEPVVTIGFPSDF